MGHIAHSNSSNKKAQLRNAMIKMIKREKNISFLRIEWSLFVKASSSLVKYGPMGLEEKKSLNFINVFSLFRYYLPMEKGEALYLNKLESPLLLDKGVATFEQT